ncbi:MAG: hypothetical protein R2710_25730 [Acidimicrobiales bacterium]
MPVFPEHTAALRLRRRVGKKHHVTVVSPNSKWNWIPSNIWVGVDKMSKDEVVFPLAPIYAKQGIDFVQGKATEIWPENRGDDTAPSVTIELTAGEVGHCRSTTTTSSMPPVQLKFEMTPGLGPSGHSLSVCTADPRPRPPLHSTV